MTAPTGVQFARLNFWVLSYGGSVLWDDASFGLPTGMHHGASTLPGSGTAPIPTVVRSKLNLPPSLITHCSSLMTSDGRRVLELAPGPCCGSSSYNLRHLAPGVYFVLLPAAGTCAFRPSVVKVVVLPQN